jgi:maleylacetate reductase
MESFTLEGRTQRVVFSLGALDAVAGEIDRLGAHKVLLIAGGSAKPLGDEIAVRLGDRVAATLAEVRQHVPEQLALAARETARAYGIDAILTVGGGSATGLGKAVALTTGAPIVAVPTTYAGSELTDVYGITGEHKQTGRDARVLPKTVLYDPSLTVELAARATGTTGFNALAHAVEAMYAPQTNPVVRLHALEGIAVLAAALPECVQHPDDLDARGRAQYGAYLAGTAFAVAGTALHHKLCHVLGGSFGLVHGEVNAVLLPYVVAYNQPAVPEAMERVARALAEPSDAAGALRALAHTLQLPTNLAEIGMPAHGLETAAERAVAAVGSSNPRAVVVSDMRRLLEAAYAGREPADAFAGAEPADAFADRELAVRHERGES